MWARTLLPRPRCALTARGAGPAATLARMSRTRIARLVALAAGEHGRARSAAELAVREDALAMVDGSRSRRLHLGAAEAHRRTQALHESTAALHEAQAARLDAAAGSPRPLLAAIGFVLGEQSVALHLVSTRGLVGSQVVTDDLAAACRDLEMTLGEGPGAEAVRTAHTSTCGDRWPTFHADAADLGVHSAAAAPLMAGGRPAGALATYSPSSSAATQRSVCQLESMADVVVGLLFASDDDLVVDPLQMLDPASESVLQQAVGMVAQRLRRGPADAMDVLRANAFGTGRSLAEVSRDVVARRLEID